MNFRREMEGSALKCALCSSGYDEGSQLLRCSRCKIVFYCSKECAPAPPTKRFCALFWLGGILTLSCLGGCAGASRQHGRRGIRRAAGNFRWKKWVRSLRPHTTLRTGR